MKVRFIKKINKRGYKREGDKFVLRQDITEIKNGVNDVISLRCDTGVYKAIKERAKREIVNNALYDYLNNYLQRIVRKFERI